MTYRTADTAGEMLCPLAKTFLLDRPFEAGDEGCKGPKCAVWRWATTQAWRDAVSTVAKEIEEGYHPNHGRVS